MYPSSDKHYEVIHYFLADTEMNLIRLVDYMQSQEVLHLLEPNEKELLVNLTDAFLSYNKQEKRQWKLQSESK